MEKISYEVYQAIMLYLQSGEKTKEEKTAFFQEKGINSNSLIESLTSLVAAGKKHVSALDKIFKEDGELSVEDIVKYVSKIIKLIQYHKFASPLVVREIPTEGIEDFKQSVWQQVTKTNLFKDSDYEGKKLVLTLCYVFGVFEDDLESINRLSALINMVQGKKQLDLEKFKGLDMSYEPQFLSFIRENASELTDLNLQRIQSNWTRITRCVDIKTPENIQRYMQIDQEKDGNEFETYMEYHNVPESKIAKYRIIYNYMLGRTETSMPTVSGQADKGYSYEMLKFSDIRVMRFGETVKCCQGLGKNAETSMINSAIEATSRVMMITDEEGKPIAGSFVTHKIDKNGRSYVCFDSIEVNASKLPVKAVAYSKTLNRISKMVDKGIIPSASLEDIEEYFYSNPDQKDISEGDIKALRINKKIRETYQAAIQDMIVEDEKRRKNQLIAGEITQEEYEHLLIKNGLITVGRNPVSMYLKDLPKVDKKNKEVLPAIRKDRAIYKKAHKLTIESVLEKIAEGLVNAALVITPLALIAWIPPFIGIPTAVYGILGKIYLKQQRVDGIYSDATKDQRVFYDGRGNIDYNVHDRDKLQSLREELVYSEYDVVSKPIQIANLTEEQRKQYRRLRESAGQADFTEQENDRYVIGNGQNWAVTLSREGNELTVHDISMLNSFGFTEKIAKLTDAQIQLLETLETLAEHSDSISFKCGDEKINCYLSRNIKVPTQRGVSKEKQVIESEEPDGHVY